MKWLDFNGIGEVLFELRFPKRGVQTVPKKLKASAAIPDGKVWLVTSEENDIICDKYMICENKQDLAEASQYLNKPIEDLSVKALTRRALYHTELRRYEPDRSYYDRHNALLHGSYAQRLERMSSWHKFGHVSKKRWPHPSAIISPVGLLLVSPIVFSFSYLLAAAFLMLPVGIFSYQWYLNKQPRFTFTEQEHQQFSKSCATNKAEPQTDEPVGQSYTPMNHHRKSTQKGYKRGAAQPSLFKPGLFKPSAIGNKRPIIGR